MKLLRNAFGDVDIDIEEYQSKMTFESKHRRQFLLTAAAGSASAGLWTKPLIETVLLPAHAQTSPGITSSATATGSESSSGSSSGATTVSSGSGGSSGSGSGEEPKLTMIPPSYTSDTLSGGACVENCDGSDMLLVVDIYDSDGTLVGSYQDTAAISSTECVEIDVPSSTFGFDEWPEDYMFVIAVAVPDCVLEDSSSGFFTGIKDL